MKRVVMLSLAISIAFIGLLCVSATITVALGGCALAYGLIHSGMPITTMIQIIFGGLGHATILACAIFAAISGSSVATAMAIGLVMIPAMKKAGYEEDVSAALVATAGCLGPSIPFIIYGVTANVLIAALFLGGVLPGIVMALSLMVYMAYTSLAWASENRFMKCRHSSARVSFRSISGGTCREMTFRR